ncbi:MmgE/PrpD family protein [Streptomyces sp. NPDC050625]|uniref:MmgE/PrpD family protein n=1 Tax=Streptomyces sp. NPDC050625 TaxID=3154629 RepID=UPI00342D88E0
MTQSYTSTLAEHAVSVRFEDLPPTTVEATKVLILDTLAATVGGRHMPSTQIVADVRLAEGGLPQARVLNTGEWTSIAGATHVNAHMTNALDIEDTISHSGHHSACTVPPALTVAEAIGASGEDLIAAVAVSYDIGARIARSCQQLNVVDGERVEIAAVTGLTYAAFSSVIATGCLIGLSADQMRHAIGITMSTAGLPTAGRWAETRSPRPMTKYAMYGALAEAGVRAAYLASAGFTADMDALDGERGFWRIISSLSVDWEWLTKDLGELYLGDQTSFKLFPACHWAIPALDIFDRIRREEDLKAGDISVLEARVPAGAVAKFMDRPDVDSVIDGQFSIPHALALAAVYGDAGPHWHTEKARTDPDVLGFRDRVAVVPNADADAEMRAYLLKHGYCDLLPTEVTVRTVDGRTFTGFQEYGRGDFWEGCQTASYDDIARKFLAFASPSLAERAGVALDLIGRLEFVGDVTELVNALCQEPSS